MEMPCGSSDFLENLLDQMMSMSVPMLSDDSALVVQDSPLLNMPDEVLKQAVSNIPLKERVLFVASMCKRLRAAVIASITSIEFYKEEMDCLKDNSLKYFISTYGQDITSLNFDLFRSSFIEECTQWAWRQSVVSCISLCPKLEELSVLVCNRHRLRDNDLIKIFKHAPNLKALSIDAQFIKGHCFQGTPATLQKLELEICSRISSQVIKYIYNIKQLKTLCLSQLLCLQDSIVYGIVANLQNLEDLALVMHGHDVSFPDLTATGLSMLGRLKNLQHLALEGIPLVTDRFLEDLSDNKKPMKRRLKSLSLAFCSNFSSIGLQKLATFPLLEDLNIDGCSKRDLSSALEAIAAQGRLKRLLIAENCSVDEQTLLRIVATSPNLRLLDITGAENTFSWDAAASLINSRHQLHRSNELILLTDKHIPWSHIPRPMVPIKVVHVLPTMIPPTELFSNSILSSEAPSQLSPGILSAKLRRGNRCRLLCSALSFNYSSDDKENSPKRSSLSPEQPALSLGIPTSPLAHLSNFIGSLSPVCESSGTFGEKDLLNLTNTHGIFEEQVAMNQFPQDFDTMSLMSMLLTDPCHDIHLLPNIENKPQRRSTGGGAPRPPIEIPEQPTVHHTRGPRFKRRSAGVRPKLRTDQGACFSANDFPPLGSS